MEIDGIPGGNIYVHKRADGAIADIVYTRQPELAGPVWDAVIVLPQAQSDGSVIPSLIIVDVPTDRNMSARRLAEVADWLTALYQLAEEQDAKYPNGFETEAAEEARIDAALKARIDAKVKAKRGKK